MDMEREDYLDQRFESELDDNENLDDATEL
jgi:hypothetical protein